jgi:hypothetical protein
MSESATATISDTQIGPDSYRYGITLTDAGTTQLGTFWFAWVPGQDYLDTSPTSVSDPTGWEDLVTNADASDGFGIQWHVVSTSADELSPGNSLSFTFDSTDTPAEVFGDSNFYPTTPVLTAFVYSGGEPFQNPSGGLDLGFVFHPSVACFRAGTPILTSRGNVPVEALRVGDLLATPRTGGMAPVRWLGHRRVDCRRYQRPEDVWPVRVACGAFAPGRPARDLWLSPDHAVYLAGIGGDAPDALIPIRHLINGASVVQQPVAEAVYWHIELPAHEVILAEMLPAESYLDTGNRAAFANGGPAVRMHADPALRVWEAEACAPLVLEGAALTAARRRLLAGARRLGHALTNDPGFRVLAGGRDLPGTTDGRRWRVRLPDAAKDVRLVSRVWCPAHTRPDERDTRSLGIAISRLWLDRREVSLESPALRSGWHACEPGWRWTDGDAAIAVAGGGEITVEVAMTGTYWREDWKAAARAA